MLDKITVKRFKSIRQQEIGLGRVNLFIGGNGSGKSNVLEAIGLAAACLDRGLNDADVARKGLRVTPAELMKSSFKNEDLPKTLEIEVEFRENLDYKAVLSSSQNDPLLKFFSESSHYKNERIFGRSHRGARATGVPHASRLDPHRGIWDQIKATYDIPDSAANILDNFSRYAIYTPQTDFLRGRQKGHVTAPPIGLHGEGLPEAVRSFLSDLSSLSRRASTRNRKESESLSYCVMRDAIDLVWLPGWAEKVSVGHLDDFLSSRDLADRSSEMVYFVDRFMHAKRNTLSVYDSSEGTLFLLFAAILLAHSDAPRIFALDNVDNALNPRLTRRLVSRIIATTSTVFGNSLDRGAKQVFLTSHNPTSLDAFDIFDDSQRIFVVRRNDRGHTELTRLKPEKSMSRDKWEIATRGRNLSQLWIDGEIKGALTEDTL